MSIINNISTLPDTRMTFSQSKNTLALIRGVFLSKKSFSFASQSDFEDIDVWHQAITDGDITPLHYVQEYQPQNEETQYQESVQDFSYKSRNGRYRHKLRYDWNIDFHQAVQSITESDLYVFYWDKNWNIYGTQSGATIRGFKTNRISLEKLLLAESNTPAFSVLDIELRDSSELNDNGVISQVSWNPKDVDRLFMHIEIDYIDSDNLNFTANYNGTTISDIEQDDVTVTDSVNGELTFNQFNLLGGIYQLSDFDSELITGTLKIISNLYLGCANYRVVVSVDVTNSIVFEDGNNWIFENGDNWIDEN